MRSDFATQIALNVHTARSIGASVLFPVHTMGSPNIRMTLKEVYLDFRTDPVGSLGVRDSLVETGIYAGSDLYLAWSVGSQIGAGLNYLIETYTPSLGDTIGGTEYGMVQDIEEATNEFQQGRYEQSLDSLFGSPLGNIGDYTGDNNVGSSYGFYESQSGNDC